jgi:hypothetical protein
MPHGSSLHRAHSFADFGHQQIDGYPMQPSYGHRHSLSGNTQSYHPQTIHEQPHPIPIMHRAPSLPAHSSYYVPEQNNPGVATLNTNPPPIQTYQIPRQTMEGQPHEIIQSSPSSYSSASRASPVSQEPYYTHHSTQAATYALHNSSPIEQQQQQQQQQQPMIHYQLPPQQMPPQQAQQQPQPMPAHPQPVAHVQEHYHHAPPHHEAWYEQVATYQAPEVVAHIQAFPPNNVFQNPWLQKIEHYDDPSLQMPSARLENL